MKKSIRRSMMLRWSFVAPIVVAVYWAIKYFLFGLAPSAQVVVISNSWSIELPFVLSGLWDVVVAPIWAALFVGTLWLITPKDESVSDFRHRGTSAFLYSSICGIVFGYLIEPVMQLIFSVGAGFLIAGLSLILFRGASESVREEIKIFGGVGVAIGFSAGFGAGLNIGLLLGLIVGVVSGIIFCALGILISPVFSWILRRLFLIGLNLGSSIIKWLTGR